MSKVLLRSDSDKVDEVIKYWKVILEQGLLQYYNQGGNHYTERVTKAGYIGPAVTASYLHKYIQQHNIKEIIDIGAGTGLVAAEFRKLSSSTDTAMDGLEPSTSFFENSEHRQLYKKHICHFIGNKQSEIADDSYDAAVCCGAFIPGHIPCKGLKEIIRIVKPGGIIVILTRRMYFEASPEFTKFEPLIEELQLVNKVKILETVDVPNFYSEHTGALFVLEVKESGFKEYVSKVVEW